MESNGNPLALGGALLRSHASGRIDCWWVVFRNYDSLIRIFGCSMISTWILRRSKKAIRKDLLHTAFMKKPQTETMQNNIRKWRRNLNLNRSSTTKYSSTEPRYTNELYRSWRSWASISELCSLPSSLALLTCFWSCCSETAADIENEAVGKSSRPATITFIFNTTKFHLNIKYMFNHYSQIQIPSASSCLKLSNGMTFWLIWAWDWGLKGTGAPIDRLWKWWGI